MEKHWEWERSNEAAPPFPLATCCPGEEICDQVVPPVPTPWLLGADTDASGGAAITKGFIRERKCDRDGAVGRDACSMLQPLLSAGFVDRSFPFFLHSLLSKGLYSLYKEKQLPGKDV